MFSRLIATAAVVVGTALFCLPVHAQMGATGGGTGSGGMGPSGTMNPQGGAMGTQGNMKGNMGSQGNVQGNTGMQGNMGGRRMRGEAGERQMTECLNMAASQGQNYGACRR
jgi:hypothetical protein